MQDSLYRDMRTNTVVRIVREINATTVMVMRLKNKTRYITDVCNLKKLGIK